MSKQTLITLIEHKNIDGLVKAKAINAIERIATTGEAGFNPQFATFQWSETKEGYDFWDDIFCAAPLADLPAESSIAQPEGKGEVKPLTPLPWQLEIVEDGDCDSDGMGGTVSWGTGQDVFSGCIGHRNMQTGDFDVVAENLKEQDAQFIVDICNASSAQQQAIDGLIDACNATLDHIRKSMTEGVDLTDDIDLREIVTSALSPFEKKSVPETCKEGR